MTRMRTVAFYGVTTVLVGFILVVWKIANGRDFVWLLRRHLWTLAIAVYLLAITPVDMLVHWYNVERVLAGDPAPSVQITEHPVSSEGVLMLHPLVDCDDAILREGIRAMLAERALELEGKTERRHEDHWTSYQAADALLLEQLRDCRGDWGMYTNDAKRRVALDAFRKYAYQWY
jgi:hypothetical protein